MVPPTCGAALLHEIDAVLRRQVLQDEAQAGELLHPLRQIALDEHRLAVEDVDLGIDVLAVHQERHADLFHALQHAHDLLVVGDAGGRIGGGVGRIELHAGEHAVAEAALDVVGVGVVGEVAGHQRLEGRARRHAPPARARGRRWRPSWSRTGGIRFGIRMARPKCLAVYGITALSMAPSRTCRCQSSGLRMVMRVVMRTADLSAVSREAGPSDRVTGRRCRRTPASSRARYGSSALRGR